MLIPTFLYPLLQSAVLLLCGYKSFKAIESKNGVDDTKWLTFWFVYCVIAFGKCVLDYVAFIIPLYNEINLGLICYLAFAGGAQQAYAVLGPLLKQHEAAIDDAMKQAGQKAQDALSQATEAIKKDSTSKKE